MANKQDLSVLRAAIIDGRTHNIYYRIEQLTSLHSHIVQIKQDILKAIKSYSGVQQSEAELELAVTLERLRQHHDRLDPKAALEQEYAPAHGRSDETRRVPVGLVVIQPTSHTLFFSTFAPIISAIATGNCVAVQLPDGGSALSKTIHRLIRGALDNDAFAIITQAIQDPELIQRAVQITPSSLNSTETVKDDHRSGKSLRLVVAFVDRSADVDRAAQAIVQARFAFNGKSPHAPDIVLVNEFAKSKLFQALVKHTIAQGPVLETNNKNKALTSTKAVAEAQKELNANIVTTSSRGAVVEVSQRGPKLWQKCQNPLVTVHSVRSLDDGIDLVTNAVEPDLLALYTFGDLKVCKYLCQFVPARTSWVNHIPVELLLGPSIPPAQLDPIDQFPTTMFSRRAPISVRSLTANNGLISVSEGNTSSIGSRLSTATQSLPTPKRGKQMTAAFGFFEQAFVLNMAFRAVSVVGLLASAVWWYRGVSK